MSLIHGYFTSDPHKAIKQGSVLADSHFVEVESPYGTIKLETTIWMKTLFINGKMEICDSSIREGNIPVGEQVTTP